MQIPAAKQRSATTAQATFARQAVRAAARIVQSYLDNDQRERIAVRCVLHGIMLLRENLLLGGHDLRYAVDSAKVRGLGWAPRHEFDAWLDETIEWYRSRDDWWRPLKERGGRS